MIIFVDDSLLMGPEKRTNQHNRTRFLLWLVMLGMWHELPPTAAVFISDRRVRSATADNRKVEQAAGSR